MIPDCLLRKNKINIERRDFSIIVQITCIEIWEPTRQLIVIFMSFYKKYLIKLRNFNKGISLDKTLTTFLPVLIKIVSPTILYFSINKSPFHESFERKRR